VRFVEYFPAALRCQTVPADLSSKPASIFPAETHIITNCFVEIYTFSVPVGNDLLKRKWRFRGFRNGK
jgi:hypothetical protein